MSPMRHGLGEDLERHEVFSVVIGADTYLQHD
jgi:hypothetical protein